MARKLRFIAASSAAILITAGVGTTARAETLQEAVRVLLETNPELRASAFTRNASDEVVRQAKADYYPKIDIEAGRGVQEFQKPDGLDLDPKTARIGLRQNLFTGFATKNNVRRTKAHMRASAYQVRDTSNNVALNTSKAYLDVLLKQQLVGLANENLVIHKRIKDQIELRSGSGVSRRADVDQIMSRMALAQSNVVNTKANLIDAQTKYQAVVGHVPQDLVQPESIDHLMPASLEEAERLAVEEHPRLMSTESDLRAREAQHDIAKAPYYPTFDLELDKVWEDEVYINPDQAKRESWIAFLRMRWNLFNGLKDDARSKETAYQIEEAKEIRNNSYRQVIESIRLSWASYQAAMDRLGFLEERATTARKTADAYDKQWNIGQRTLLDVLDSEAEVINAREKLYEAQSEKYYAEYRILDSLGRLVPSLGLQYPEQAYLEEDEQEDQAEPEAAVETKEEPAPAAEETKMGPG